VPDILSGRFGNLLYIIKALLRRGPGFILLYLRESLAFDLVHGTNTHLRVPKAAQTVAGAEYDDGVLYVASLTSVVCDTLALAEKLLGAERFRDAQFFDLGCGKGKTLLVYAMLYGQQVRYPAVGIEYELALCEVASKNIRKFKPAAGRVEVHCDSALNVDKYIRSQFQIVYLYNPFQGDTLQAVLRAITKRPHVLVYVDPVERDSLVQYGYQIHAAHQGRHHASTWLVAIHEG
jgi:hypothetical protein